MNPNSVDHEFVKYANKAMRIAAIHLIGYTVYSITILCHSRGSEYGRLCANKEGYVRDNA